MLFLNDKKKKRKIFSRLCKLFQTIDPCKYKLKSTASSNCFPPHAISHHVRLPPILKVLLAIELLSFLQVSLNLLVLDHLGRREVRRGLQGHLDLREDHHGVLRGVLHDALQTHQAVPHDSLRSHRVVLHGDLQNHHGVPRDDQDPYRQGRQDLHVGDREGLWEVHPGRRGRQDRQGPCEEGHHGVPGDREVGGRDGGDRGRGDDHDAKRGPLLICER